MARRKGKSKSRIKNWHQMYNAGEDVEAAEGRSKLAPRKVKLGSGSFANSGALDDLPVVDGMVVCQFPGGVIVRTETTDLLCGIARTFRAPAGSTPLAVGDIATVALTNKQPAGADISTDKDRADGMILSRSLRESALARPQPRSGKRRDEYKSEIFEKIIVANVKTLLIVAATREPPLRKALIDRFLIAAERGELKPVLVINKIDLQKPDDDVVAEFTKLGVEVHLCSAQTRQGLDALLASLAGGSSVLAGASGVGKTTLINAIIPHTDAKTRQVRQRDQRGRHTTSAAKVYLLDNGGKIIDTPGIRELGMKISPADLPWYFPEFETASSKCKFNNCTHTHEPDCAVQIAVQEGAIPQRRYNSYLRLLESLDN